MPGHKPEEVAEAIHAEIERLKAQDISDDELKMIKTRAKANLIRGLANDEGLAFQLAIYQARYDDWRELFRSVDRIDKVTKADIRKWLRKRLCQPTAPWESSRPRHQPRRRKAEVSNEAGIGNPAHLFGCDDLRRSRADCRMAADQGSTAAGVSSSGAQTRRAAERDGDLSSGRSRTAID